MRLPREAAGRKTTRWGVVLGRPNADALRVRMSIVAVSSEAGFLHLIQTLFDGAAPAVRTTSDWDAAPALVTRLQPGLVVLDLRPWEDTCWRMLEALKASASTRAIPVLVCPVAARLLNGHELLLALPGVHVWPEGFRVEELLETVQFALPSSQAWLSSTWFNTPKNSPRQAILG